MSQQRRAGRLGKSIGGGLLALAVAIPVPAQAQTPNGTPAVTTAAAGTPSGATPSGTVAGSPSPGAATTPSESATAAGSPVGGTPVATAVSTATPRPVIVPDCGPGMAGLAPGVPPPQVRAAAPLVGAPGAPASVAPPPPVRPTAPPTAAVQPTGSPQPAGSPSPGVTVSPSATRRPSTALVQELRGLTRDLVGELFRIDQDLVIAAGALRQAEADLEQLGAEIVALEAEMVRKQAAMDERGAVYGTRLRAIYKYTRTSPLEEILSSRSFGEMLKRMTMLQAVARVDNRLLVELRNERDALRATAEQLREKRQAVVVLKAEIEEQQRILVVRREEQAAAVSKAQLEQSQVEAAFAAQQVTALAGRIVALQVQLVRELDALERLRPTAVPAQRPPATATPIPPTSTPIPATATPRPGASPTGLSGPAGTPGAETPSPQPTRPPLVVPPSFRPLLWPVANAVVTTEFGEPTFAQVFHSGIDLAQRLYAPVVAAEDGIVLACGYAVPGERTLSYGLFIILAHDRTISSLYAHLDDEVAPPPVRIGDTVRRGQVIGYLGLTGLTTGPHLHFEVRAGGQIYDPRDLLIR